MQPPRVVRACTSPRRAKRLLGLVAAAPKVVLLCAATYSPIARATDTATGQATGQATAVARDSTQTASLVSLSPYERETLSRVLRERRMTLEAAPTGKWIDGIDVEPLEVFEPSDPLPQWVNWLHATSRSEVIAREVLLRQGTRYDPRLAQETARNLRSLRQLSLVLVVPIKSKEPGRIRLLVVTKDVWSLRLNSAFRMRNGHFEYLLLQPSEENAFGHHLRIAGQYVYDLSTNTFGASVGHQRLLGSRIAVSAAVNAITHRGSGRMEGTSGSFMFGQPLYSSQTRWAWATSALWSQRIHRYLLPAAGGSYVPRLYDDPTTPEPEAIPYRFRSRQLTWQTAVTRSFGLSHKLNYTVGLETVQRRFSAQNLVDDGYDPKTVASFEHRVLERSDVRIGPFAQFDTYQNRFVSLYDVETLGLQEDFQVGHRAFVKTYAATKRAMSTRDLLGVSTGIDYTISVAGSLERIWALHTAEISPVAAESDSSFQTGLRLVTPSFGLGRLVYDGGLTYRYQDYRNVRYDLGGDGRLRGYPSQQFLGKHVVASNLEFRSRSVSVMQVLFGLVGFYDVGDAFDSFRTLAPKHSVGFGARATAPQLQRVVARLDVAFPLTEPRSALGERWGGVDVLLTLDGQAFAFPVPKPSSSRSPLVAAE